MPAKPREEEREIRISEGTGKASSMSEMVDWALQVLSGGNVEAYALDVLKRAEAAPQVTA